MGKMTGIKLEAAQLLKAHHHTLPMTFRWRLLRILYFDCEMWAGRKRDALMQQLRCTCCAQEIISAQAPSAAW